MSNHSCMYVVIQCIMAHQETKTIASPCSSAENSACVEEESDLLTDFDNVENILDFNAHSSSDTATANSKSRPRKMIAKEPVKLLELKPMIDNYVGIVRQDCDNYDDVDYTTDSERRFCCFVCGQKFFRSSHLHRHMRIHTGDKPYACHICRKRFSRSDYQLAHEQCHHKEKLHCCCVCGKMYFDLAKFTDHCQLHDDSEYIRIAMSNTNEPNFKRQVQTAEDTIIASTFKEQLELSSCVTIEKVDNSTEEDYIVCVENSIYLSNHHQVVSSNYNGTTAVNDTNSSDSLIISINIASCSLTVASPNKVLI